MRELGNCMRGTGKYYRTLSNIVRTGASSFLLRAERGGFEFVEGVAERLGASASLSSFTRETRRTLVCCFRCAGAVGGGGGETVDICCSSSDFTLVGREVRSCISTLATLFFSGFSSLTAAYLLGLRVGGVLQSADLRVPATKALSSRRFAITLL